jgi:hypothetical protein
MTSDEIIQKFDELPRTIYPLKGQPVIIDGDEWAGLLVVKVEDLLHLMAWLIGEVEGRRVT